MYRMEWAAWQAAVSAEMDGEDPGVERAALRRFEASHPRATGWLAEAHRLNRAARLGSTPEPLPVSFLGPLLREAERLSGPGGLGRLDGLGRLGELDGAAGTGLGVDGVDGLAAADDRGAGGGRDRDHEPAVTALRAGVAALAVVAALVAGPYLVVALRVGDQAGAQWACVSLAAALALGYAAARPGRCGPVCGLLAVAGVLATVASAVGVATGRTSWNLEAHHLVWVLGAMLVGVLYCVRRETWPDRHRPGPVGPDQ